MLTEVLIMNIRLAEAKDIKQLIRMRWDFTIEYDESNKIEQTSFNDFENWKIVSHIYIELIQKIPRPGRITSPFAYMTNVYTIKEFYAHCIEPMEYFPS